MVTEVTAVAFRQRLGEMIAQVQYGGNSIVVTKDGDRVAALVDAAMFDRIRAMRDRFDELSTRVADAYAGIPEHDGLAEIDAIVEAERHGRR